MPSHTSDGGEGVPIARPEAVEGVAVGVLLCVVGGVVRMQKKLKTIRIKVLKYFVSTNKSTTFAVFK